MLSEALETLRNMIERPIWTQVDESHRRTKLLDSKNGTTLTVDHDHPPYTAKVYSIASLREIADTFPEFGPIWVSESSALLSLDDFGYRKDYVHLPLHVSEAFAVIRNLCLKPMTVPDAVQMVADIESCCVEMTPPSVVESIGNLKFERTDSEDHRIQDQDESVARSIRNKVTGPTLPVPDSVIFKFRPYPELRNELPENAIVSVIVGVSVHPTSRTIKFRCMPDIVAAAKTEARMWILKAIKASFPEATVLLGSPTSSP